MTEPSASSAASSEIPHHNNHNNVNHDESLNDPDQPQPRSSRSPLRPSPIITENLKPAPATGADAEADAAIDDAISSADSPLSALSTPPDSPTEDVFLSTTTTNGHTNGHSGEGKTNGHTHTAGTPGDERPSKRRKVGESTSPPPGTKRKLVESPPWKKFEADGPTTIIENGKRKSGRINTVPLDQMNSDKRITRKSYSQASPPTSKYKHASVNGQTPSGQAAKRAASASKALQSKSTASSKPASRKSLAYEPRSLPSKRKPSPSPAQPSRSSTRTRGPSRGTWESLEHEHTTSQSSRNMSRIKLRVNRPPLTELPLVHPERVGKKKLASNLEEYFKTADDVPVTEGGQFIPDDEPIFTDEIALAEAKTIIRIEDEARPGGLLDENCAVFEPEPAEEPPRQYAHLDHVVKAAQNLRKWMIREQRHHREQAKKLADACQAVWRSRQPKTQGEIEKEARDMWIGRYRVVMRAMFGTWENVRTEVNRKRLEEWEAEEQRRVKAALQEAVSRSEQQLLARQAQFDSDITDDEDLDDDDEDIDLGSQNQGSGDDEESNGDLTSDDEDNMSSSDEDDRKSVASDEGLTQEQLQAKYANLPDLDKAAADDQRNGDETPMAAADTVLDNDTSDESVDMDDDMGTSDEESDDSGSDDEQDGSGDEDEDDQPSGLLGLLFGKKELKELEKEAVEGVAEGDVADTEMADADATTPVGSVEQPEKTETKDRTSTLDVNGTTDVSISPAETSSAHQHRSLDSVPHSPSEPEQRAVPAATTTAPPSEAMLATSEADATTNPASPERSQSPRTSDSKPSEIDTATSVERLTAPRDVTRLLAEKPMSTVSLGFLNLVPTQHEDLSSTTAERIHQLSAHRALMDLRETQRIRSQASHHILDPSTIKSTIGFLDSAARWGRFEELQHCVYLNALRRQQRPIYGKRLREFLTIGVDKRPYKPRPRVPKEVMSWFEGDSYLLRTLIPTLDQRASSLEGIISKFACVTPAVVTRDLDRFLLGPKGVQAFEETDLKLSAPVSVQDVADGLMGSSENDVAANAAMDLVLGGVEKSDTRTVTKVLEQAEDTEDVVAARAAEREFQQDDADFSETKPASGAASTRQGTPHDGPAAPRQSTALGPFAEPAETPAVAPAAEEVEPEYNAFGGRMRNIDEFMLSTMAKLLEGTVLELPKDKKKGKKKGRDTRKR
ncbi:hypothetical protein VSDG_08637 [Cytospora chrysosperma]|uniref:HSA domain-containing protein n=1 Tax=Cytospora chrysosperma TaxID=252740 RepID=A0A423VEE8_CYTCH|nr:hypothetical protein VSDG_08637 [Valsa sordida]